MTTPRKVEGKQVGDRRVFSVSALNEGVSLWLSRLPQVWVEGEVTDLRRNEAWATVFLTLKDPATGACVPVTMQRRRFDALELGLENGERVHVLGRAELYEAKGELAFRARTIERFGLGEHLAALERLAAALAAEGLFQQARKRPLPTFPRAVGVLTGADAAARGDLVTGIRTRFPPAHIVVAETRVQGPGSARRITTALERLARHPAVDVIVLTRGGGSFEDLLPFSDEAVVRAVAACAVPVVSAVGHEQDRPLCDLAADARASTPTAAARLVVPDLDELRTRTQRSGERLRPATRRVIARERERLDRRRNTLRAAPTLLLERRRTALDRAGSRLIALSPRATLTRGYAIVRVDGRAIREAARLSRGQHLDVELADGAVSAVVDDVRP